MLTRKHFKLIARAVADSRPQAPAWPANIKAHRNSAIDNVAFRLAAVLQSDNFRFNRQRFLDACAVAPDHPLIGEHNEP